MPKFQRVTWFIVILKARNELYTLIMEEGGEKGQGEWIDNIKYL